METSRPKLILNRKGGTEDARSKDKFSSEGLLEESRASLVRSKRNKNAFENTEDRCISSKDDEITSFEDLSTSVSLGFENSNSTFFDENKGKIAEVKSVVEDKLLNLSSSTDMNIININQNIGKEALLEKADPCGVRSVTSTESLIKKIFPMKPGVNDDVMVHSAFRELKVDQVKKTRAIGPSEKHCNKSGFKTRHKGENGNWGNRSKKSKDSSCKTIKNTESTLSECSDDICDFVEEYQNLDMLFGEA